MESPKKQLLVVGDRVLITFEDRKYLVVPQAAILVLVREELSV